jgi:hypothetical protein
MRFARVFDAKTGSVFSILLSKANENVRNRNEKDIEFSVVVEAQCGALCDHHTHTTT